MIKRGCRPVMFGDVLRFFAVVVWMGVIFGFSAQQGADSAGMSLVVCHRIAEAVVSIDVFPSLFGWLGSPDTLADMLAEKIHWFVRKAAHVTEYAILGILLWRFIERIISGRKIFTISFSIGVAYACTDELHQLFIPGRGCSFADILIDSNGVLFGIGVVRVLSEARINHTYR